MRPLARSSLLSSSKFKNSFRRCGFPSARNIRARRSRSSLGTNSQYDSCRTVSMLILKTFELFRDLREIAANRIAAPLGTHVVTDSLRHRIAVGNEPHQHQREVGVGHAPLIEQRQTIVAREEALGDAEELVDVALGLLRQRAAHRLH